MPSVPLALSRAPAWITCGRRQAVHQASCRVSARANLDRVMSVETLTSSCSRPLPSCSTCTRQCNIRWPDVPIRHADGQSNFALRVSPCFLSPFNNSGTPLTVGRAANLPRNPRPRDELGGNMFSHVPELVPTEDKSDDSLAQNGHISPPDLSALARPSGMSERPLNRPSRVSSICSELLS